MFGYCLKGDKITNISLGISTLRRFVLTHLHGFLQPVLNIIPEDVLQVTVMDIKGAPSQVGAFDNILDGHIIKTLFQNQG